MKMIFIIYYFRKDSIWDVQTICWSRYAFFSLFYSLLFVFVLYLHSIFTFVQIIHGSAFECHTICFTVTNGTHTRTHIMNRRAREGDMNERKTNAIDNAAVIRCVQFYGVWFGLNIHNIKPANSRKQHKNAEKSTHRKVEKKDDNEYSRIRKNGSI